MSSESSDAAVLPEESSEVQVLDSNEPLVKASSSVPSSAKVINSIPTRVQVLASNEPLVLPSSSSLEEPVAGPSYVAGPSELSSNEASNRMASLIMPILADDEPIHSGSSGRQVHLQSDEIRSMWTWRKVFTRLGSQEQYVEFAEDKGLVPTAKMCPYHRQAMRLEMGHGVFGRFVCRKTTCRQRRWSRAAGTWFEEARLPLTTIFELMYAFSDGRSYEWVQKQLSNDDEPVLSFKTIADWYSYCREVIVIYALEHITPDTKIGGPNKIVQIDESKFGRRKYNRGRHIEGHWVIGMTENGSDDLRLEVCPNNERSAEILVPLIKKHVQEGSIIHTDFWRAYQCLPEHGYIHKRVNHSDPLNKFVAPDGTHTQRIESQWRPLKQVFRQQHNKSDFTDWLAEYSWRRHIKITHKDPFEELLLAIKHVYNLQ